MQKYITQAVQAIESLQVTQDEYEHWKNNKVTQRLMADFELALFAAQVLPVAGVSVEELAVNAAKKNEFVKNLEHILEWKPQELISDE